MGEIAAVLVLYVICVFFLYQLLGAALGFCLGVLNALNKADYSFQVDSLVREGMETGKVLGFVCALILAYPAAQYFFDLLKGG